MRSPRAGGGLVGVDASSKRTVFGRTIVRILADPSLIAARLRWRTIGRAGRADTTVT